MLLATSLTGSTNVQIPPEDTQKQPPIAPITREIVPNATYTVDELISRYSAKYGVSEAVVRQVIKCESGFNPNAIGDNGFSYGLVQIHLPSHPYVSKEQALDPEFAIDFLTAKLASGDGHLWTCYRLMVK